MIAIDEEGVLWMKVFAQAMANTVDVGRQDDRNAAAIWHADAAIRERRYDASLQTPAKPEQGK